jgi:hypothetical protein
MTCSSGISMVEAAAINHFPLPSREEGCVKPDANKALVNARYRSPIQVEPCGGRVVRN